jgi:hypothetical protein
MPPSTMASNSSLDLAMSGMALTTNTSSSVPSTPPNRPNTTWAQHMTLPFDPIYNPSEFTQFLKLPAELQTIVWQFSASPAEIISIEVVRPIVFEKGSKKLKLVEDQNIPRQFSIRYKAFGVPLDSDGTYISRLDGQAFVRSGQLGACKQSRSIYLKAKPHFVRLFKQAGGGNVWFNADTDTIAIPRRTRFNLNQLRQRRRPKMVFFTGFEQIKRVVYEEEADEKTAIEILREQITTDFVESIMEIEGENFEVSSAKYFQDEDWLEAVEFEQEQLNKELKRAGVALTKVNGTVFSTGVSEGVKILFFPLTEKDLENNVEVEGEGEEEDESH